MHRKNAVLFAVLAIAAGVLLFVLAREEKKPVASTPTSASPSTSLVAAAEPAPASVVAPMITPPELAPQPAPSSKPTTPDELTRESIEDAVEAKDTSALPLLEKVDLTKDAHVAAAAIDAVGKLAALAPDPARREAVRTLDSWMKSESKRETADARGNVSILVDAFGDTKSDAAIAPLVTALDSASYPLHLETRIVESLDKLDAKSAAPSVQRFAARVAKLEPKDDLERELAKEALDTANATLAKWK